MSPSNTLSFDTILDALMDLETAFPPRYLYRFSDLSPDELNQLKELWPSIPAWRRQALLEDMESLGERDNLLFFEGLCRLALEDSEPACRLPAARILWEYELPEHLPLFIKLAKSDEDARVRQIAASALGSYIYAGELEKITQQKLAETEECLISIYTQDVDPEVRRHALESLGYSSREDVPGMIQAAYDSKEKEWKASALFAMGHSADERWTSQVLESLTSKITLIRAEAARAAGELEINTAKAALIELLQDPEENIRMASIWSLSQIGGDGVRQRLEKLYKSARDDEYREFLEAALDNLAFTDNLPVMPLLDFEGELDEEDDEDDFEDEYGDDFEEDVDFIDDDLEDEDFDD